MKNIFLILFITSITLGCTSKSNAPNTETTAAYNLIHRVIPQHSNLFDVEMLPADTMDIFEIETVNNKIVLRGTNGVAVASALYYYLTEHCNCQITWNGTNLRLPSPLPIIDKKIRKESPYNYRYYLNYCTFNYTMSWWDWERWEKEIDWMALHGINMPLAITGEEYVWDQLYRSYGFTDKELDSFFSGPAYLSWFWMGNLDGWGGPMPESWKIRQKELQIKILQRQRELGMTPVLPAFTGHVPASFKKFFPEANLKQTNWGNDFDDTFILDADDPLFAEIGRKFIELQTTIFGTDHLYSADTFNENEPPSNDPEYLAELGKKTFEGMKSADPDAIWVMQGWLFYSHRNFWEAPQIKGLLGSIPNDRMIILDLAAEIEPIWKRTEAFYGKQWIWNMLHNFGGNISLFGRIEDVATNPALALHDSNSGQMKGIGLTMEAIEQTPVLYELMTAHTWRNTPIELNDWLNKYIKNRYGTTTPQLISAWNTLVNTVYNGKVIRDGAESIIVARPTFEGYRRWARTKLNYSPEDLLPAWDNFVASIDSCSHYDGFRYDLVDITRQVLANYALPLQQQITVAYKQNNRTKFDRYSAEFIELIEDMDRLLATQRDFMLGPWIADARNCGYNTQEKDLYEQNARNLITLWGDKNNRLHEYSNRQWSGLFNDFYKPRWEKFFEQVKREWSHFDQKSFDENIKDFEWNWVVSKNEFTIEPVGSSTEIVHELHKKYRDKIIPITKIQPKIDYNY